MIQDTIRHRITFIIQPYMNMSKETPIHFAPDLAFAEFICG